MNVKTTPSAGAFRMVLAVVNVSTLAIVTAGAVPALGQGTPPAASPAATAPAKAAAPVSDGGWPKTVESGTTTFTVYQPQLDAWDGFKLEAHAAVAVAQKGTETQTFGVIWVSARGLVDKDTRLVALENLQITKVNFPSTKDEGAEYKAALQKSLPPKTKSFSLDRLEADLGILKAQEKAAAAVPIKNDPPRLVFSKTPAILVFVDGKPVFKAVENSKLKRLINTRPLVLKDSSGALFIHVYDGWLKATSLNAAWQPMTGSTKELDAVAEKLAPTNVVDLLLGQPTDPEDPKSLPSLKKGPVPKIVTSQVPTTLIVFEGEPNWMSLTGTNLLYVANTTGNVFRQLGDQKIYVLDSGRWFRAASLDGPWEYVPGTKLPKDFASIPDTSGKENTKASVPGTRQANEAVVSNSVPQTAKVDIKTAKITPINFDGKPKLEAIKGTPLKYVVNTAAPVIMVDEKTWYAVDKGVWFTATSVNGPWVVATSVPAVIYTIPASSPLYYVTYVKIYEVTPTTVVVGYTPGYTGTVVTQEQVVVYGTGYYYTPWVGAVYYPPPPTYGFGVAIRWNPYYGWSVGFGFGYSCGPVTIGIGFGCYPAWGPYYYPPYYRPPYYGYGGYYGGYGGYYGGAAWGPGGWAASTGNVYSQWGSTSAVTRTAGGYNAYTGNQWKTQMGQSYNSATGQLSSGQRAGVKNVYTGDYAGVRQGTTTNTRTGASAAGRQTIQGNTNTGNYQVNTKAGGYNPNTGTVGGGQKTTVGNVHTGQSATAASGTIGNVNTGNSVDYRGVKTDQGTGVGQVGNATFGKSSSGDVYAGSDGNVYRKDASGGWSQYDQSSGSWNPKTANVPSDLPAQAQARQNGQQRTQDYQATQRNAQNYQANYGTQNRAQSTSRPANTSTRPANTSARPAGRSGGGGGGRGGGRR